MQALVILLLIASTTFSFLVKQGWLPRLASNAPDLLSALILVYVVVAGVRTRFRYVRPAYWIAFGALLTVVVSGLLVNLTEPGPTFAGMRSYLRAMPVFFLPAVMAFTDRQLRAQFYVILAICFAQVPLAIWQRTGTIARGGGTGDYTTGTLMVSSILSMVLIGVIAVVAALYFRKRISGLTFVMLFALLAFPTTINETKGTLLLLPLALMTTYMVVSKAKTRLKNAVMMLGLLAVFGGIFVVIYDQLAQYRRYPITLSEFFTDQGKLQGYVSKGSTVGGDEAGRLDAIVVPLAYLSRDPAHLAFGLGIGNASDSSLGPAFVGRYYYLFKPFLVNSFAKLVLETGVLGVLLLLWVYWLIFQDCRVVFRKDEGMRGAFAAGWAGVTAVITLGTFYKQLIGFDSITYLFWYYSGLVAAQRMRLALAAPARAATAESRRTLPGEAAWTVRPSDR